MYIRKFLTLLMAFLLLTSLSTPAQARGFFDPLKESLQIAGDYVQEHGPGWVESGKAAANDLIEAGKEKLPVVKEKVQEKLPVVKEKAKEGLAAAKDRAVEARDQFAEWNQGQQDQFWERIEAQTQPQTQPVISDQGAKTLAIGMVSLAVIMSGVALARSK